MFLSKFVEAESSAVKMPPAVELWLEEDILEFGYTHSIYLSEDNIEAVLSAASFLQVS